MLNADQIKVLLLDYLIDEQPNFIVSELSFYKGYRKADIVVFNNNETIAYEIKSDRDKLTSLKDQMIDYSNTFGYCYVVTTEKHLNKVKKIIGDKIGLILIQDRKIVVIRKPLQNKRLSKHSLSLSVPLEELIRNAQINKGTLIYESEVYEKIIERIDSSSLKETFYETMYKKHYKKYQSFIFDRGSKTTLTDLYYLQST